MKSIKVKLQFELDPQNGSSAVTVHIHIAKSWILQYTKYTQNSTKTQDGQILVELQIPVKIGHKIITEKIPFHIHLNLEKWRSQKNMCKFTEVKIDLVEKGIGKGKLLKLWLVNKISCDNGFEYLSAYPAPITL